MDYASYEAGGDNRQCYLRISDSKYYFRIEFNSRADVVRVAIFNDELEHDKTYDGYFTFQRFMKKLEKAMREDD